MRAPHPKTIVVGLLSAGFVVLVAYFVVMGLVTLPRAEATLDRAAVRLEGPAALAAGEPGALVLHVDNRANRDAVRFRDVLVSPNVTELVYFDGRALRAQGAALEGDRITWNREIPGGGTAELRLPFQARTAGRREGALLLLFEVPRMTKGKSLPLIIEVR
jgi:hypothetical protein